MDSFTLSTASSTSPAILKTSATKLRLFPSSLCPKRSRPISFCRKPRKFSVFASKDDPKLDQWDQMELKFGRMIGEDPKLTLSKIMGRKSNPDMSYLEIEKLYGNNKGKNTIEEVPFDVSRNKPSNSTNGLNLVRPVPKKGVKFEVDDKPKKEQKRPSQPGVQSVQNAKASVPNVILRKPTVHNEDDVGNDRSSALRIRPNLTLNMGRELQKERFTDITLLKKPEPTMIKPDLQGEESSPPGDVEAGVVGEIPNNNLKDIPASNERYTGPTLVEKPNLHSEQERKDSVDYTVNGSNDLLEATKSNVDQLLEINEEGESEENDLVKGVQSKNSQSTDKVSIEAALLGRPKRLNQSEIASPKVGSMGMTPFTLESYGNAVELENFLASSPIKEHEDFDWTRAEELNKTGGRVEVELISSSTRGFVVSFGSLIGFLPYRNLAAKWKFLAFESWLRRKGLDPAMYRQNLGVIGSFESPSKVSSLESRADPQIAEKEISPDMKLEELLKLYDQEKLKFLSSFVGQKIKVSLVLADRKSRKLIFSIKPKEREELVENKRTLMGKLSVGDVVKCCIKKITYFGIFVEVEGVPALIHQTEVSWDATLDPASYFKIGQIVEAKVHQLDFALQRIFLSLKDITPDPLMGALEAVVGDHDSLDGRLEAAEADTEWPEVESLMQELQQFEGIQSVWKGRYFLSPGLAPTFQVYMAAIFEDQYKLLARSGNRVQEVMVQTSLGKEEMKSAILTCTNRVV